MTSWNCRTLPTRTPAVGMNPALVKVAPGQQRAPLHAAAEPARTLRELEVGHQRLAQDRLAEERALRDVAQQQLDDDHELVHRLLEARRGGRLGRLAGRLLQVPERLRVVQLNGLDPACASGHVRRRSVRETR